MTIFIFRFYIRAIQPNRNVTLRMTLVNNRVDPHGVILVSFFNVFIGNFFVFSGAPYEGIYWWTYSVFANIDTCPIKLYSQTLHRFYQLRYLY